MLSPSLLSYKQIDALINGWRNPFILTFDKGKWFCYFIQMRKATEIFIYGCYTISIQSDNFKFIEEEG